MEEIEITYSVFGFEDTTFSMEISEKLYDKLDDAESDGELLDSEYISEAMPRLHKNIIKAIRNNIEECSLDPDDGLIEKSTSWGAKYKEYSDAADHSWMDALTDDDDIEYSIEL